jgi:paired amphipathic helix protein Sin3a
MASFGGPLQGGEHNRQHQQQHAGQQPNPNPQHQMFAPMPHAQAPAPTSQGPAGGSTAVFGGPLQPQEGQRGGQHSNAPFPSVTPGGHQIPGGITQGQQPILNVSFLSFTCISTPKLSLLGNIITKVPSQPNIASIQ